MSADNKPFYMDIVDDEDGMKTYHVCLGGQTVCMTPGDLFDTEPVERKWAKRICDALNAQEAAKAEGKATT
jgi:hypothetical protein